MKRFVKISPFVLFVLFFSSLLLLHLVDFSLSERLRDTLTLSLGILYEAFPFVVLGTLIATIVRQFVPQALLFKFLPKRPIARRAVLSVSGSILPVCECGNVPLARGLIMNGLAPQDAMTFILGAPIINPLTAVTTHQAFASQPLMLPLRLFGAFTTANLVGWVLDSEKPHELLQPKFKNHCDECSKTEIHTNKHKSTRQTRFQKLRAFSQSFQQELTTLLPPLLAGSFVAGLIQTMLPRTWLTALGTQPVVSILAMIALAFIISICANVDAFFALSLSGVFPMSALLAFLVFGPMIDMKMLALLRTTYTTKTLVKVAAVVFLCSFTIGLGARYVF